MKWMTWTLALLAACAQSTPPPSDDPVAEIDKLVGSYAEAAWTAEKTKTHASGDHPRATAEMDRCENELRARFKKLGGKEAVRKSIDDGIARFDHARKVAPPEEIERATFRMKALQALKAKLGL